MGTVRMLACVAAVSAAFATGASGAPSQLAIIVSNELETFGIDLPPERIGPTRAGALWLALNDDTKFRHDKRRRIERILVNPNYDE